MGKQIYEIVKEYSVGLEKRISVLEIQKEKLPEVYVKFSVHNGKTQLCIRGKNPDRKIKYVSRRNKSEFNELATVLYINRVLPILKRNLKATKAFLRWHSAREESEMALQLPLDIQLINNKIYPCKEKAIEEWTNREYKRNPYMPKGLIHMTNKGEMVRSKSECMIANALNAHEMPYKLECPINVEGKRIYPDFTVLRRSDMKEIYWEHFGMMDNPEYANGACQKIHMMANHGIQIGDNLIASFETTRSPLTSQQIELLISQFLIEK